MAYNQACDFKISIYKNTIWYKCAIYKIITEITKKSVSDVLQVVWVGNVYYRLAMGHQFKVV